MSRNLTYILIAISIFFAFSLPNLLNPNRGLLFIIEEIFGSTALILGFFIFKKPIRRIILSLSEKISWIKTPINRFLVDLGIIAVLSVIVSIIVLTIGWMFFSWYGEPEFIKEKDQILKTERANQPKKRSEHDFHFEKKEFSFFQFAPSILGGCLFMFSILFVVEESFNYRNIVEKKKLEDEQEAKEQALSRLRALQNQLNPHFMFNTLNVLSGLMHEDLGKADKFIKKLSEIYRYVLIQCEEVATTLNNELEFTDAYIYLLKIRFEDQLHVSINVDENKLDWILPSLTLELLIENAIKHNSLNTKVPLEIEIMVENENLIVKNDFRPRIDQTTAIGIGIKNLQERLSVLGLRNANFEIQNEKYIATIPLLNPEL